MDHSICDCGHPDAVHSYEDEKYCETCGGKKCSVGGFRTYQRQIDDLYARLEALEALLYERTK